MSVKSPNRQLVITVACDLEEDESAAAIAIAVDKLLKQPLEVSGQLISNWYSKFVVEIRPL